MSCEQLFRSALLAADLDNTQQGDRFFLAPQTSSSSYRDSVRDYLRDGAMPSSPAAVPIPVVIDGVAVSAGMDLDLRLPDALLPVEEPWHELGMALGAAMVVAASTGPTQVAFLGDASSRACHRLRAGFNAAVAYSFSSSASSAGIRSEACRLIGSSFSASGAECQTSLATPAGAAPFNLTGMMFQPPATALAATVAAPDVLMAAQKWEADFSGPGRVSQVVVCAASPAPRSPQSAVQLALQAGLTSLSPSVVWIDASSDGTAVVESAISTTPLSKTGVVRVNATEFLARAIRHRATTKRKTSASPTSSVLLSGGCFFGGSAVSGCPPLSAAGWYLSKLANLADSNSLLGLSAWMQQQQPQNQQSFAAQTVVVSYPSGTTATADRFAAAFSQLTPIATCDSRNVSASPLSSLTLACVSGATASTIRADRLPVFFEVDLASGSIDHALFEDGGLAALGNLTSVESPVLRPGKNFACSSSSPPVDSGAATWRVTCFGTFGSSHSPLLQVVVLEKNGESGMWSVALDNSTSTNSTAPAASFSAANLVVVTHPAPIITTTTSAGTTTSTATAANADRERRSQVLYLLGGNKKRDFVVADSGAADGRVRFDAPTAAETSATGVASSSSTATTGVATALFWNLNSAASTGATENAAADDSVLDLGGGVVLHLREKPSFSASTASAAANDNKRFLRDETFLVQVLQDGNAKLTGLTRKISVTTSSPARAAYCGAATSSAADSSSPSCFSSNIPVCATISQSKLYVLPLVRPAATNSTSSSSASTVDVFVLDLAALLASSADVVRSIVGRDGAPVALDEHANEHYAKWAIRAVATSEAVVTAAATSPRFCAAAPLSAAAQSTVRPLGGGAQHGLITTITPTSSSSVNRNSPLLLVTRFQLFSNSSCGDDGSGSAVAGPDGGSCVPCPPFSVARRRSVSAVCVPCDSIIFASLTHAEKLRCQPGFNETGYIGFVILIAGLLVVGPASRALGLAEKKWKRREVLESYVGIAEDAIARMSFGKGVAAVEEALLEEGHGWGPPSTATITKTTTGIAKPAVAAGAGAAALAGTNKTNELKSERQQQRQERDADADDEHEGENGDDHENDEAVKAKLLRNVGAMIMASRDRASFMDPAVRMMIMMFQQQQQSALSDSSLGGSSSIGGGGGGGGTGSIADSQYSLYKKAKNDQGVGNGLSAAVDVLPYVWTEQRCVSAVFRIAFPEGDGLIPPVSSAMAASAMVGAGSNATRKASSVAASTLTAAGGTVCPSEDGGEGGDGEKDRRADEQRARSSAVTPAHMVHAVTKFFSSPAGSMMIRQGSMTRGSIANMLDRKSSKHLLRYANLSPDEFEAALAGVDDPATVLALQRQANARRAVQLTWILDEISQAVLAHGGFVEVCFENVVIAHWCSPLAAAPSSSATVSPSVGGVGGGGSGKIHKSTNNNNSNVADLTEACLAAHKVISSTSIKARGLNVSAGISHCSDAMVGATGTFTLQRVVVNAASLREAAHLAKLAERTKVGIVLPWVYEQWLSDMFVFRFLGKADLTVDNRLMWVAEMMAPQNDRSWDTEAKGVKEIISMTNEAMMALSRGDPELCNQLLRSPRVPSWLADEMKQTLRAGNVNSFSVPVVW